MYSYYRFLLPFLIYIFTLPQAMAQQEAVIHYEGSSTIANFIRDAETAYGKASFELITKSESAGGEISIIEGRADIGGVARVPSPQVLGKGVVSTLIGWDAIAVIVNHSNPVQNLSIEQLKGIFTNEITNWNEVGGPDLPINTYIVDKESATRNVFRSRILGQDDYINCTTISPDIDIVNRIKLEEGSIGQISFSFVEDIDNEVKLLSINGQEASVNNQSYPITRPLYLLWWPGRKMVADFAHWTQSDDAQKIITKRFIGKTQTKIEEIGKLIVYSKTESIEDGGAYFYPHEPYEIYSKDGSFLQLVNNRLELLDENPSIISLEPNQYLIWTQSAKKNGDSKILVNIEPNVTTRVSVDHVNKLEEKSISPNASSIDRLNLFGDFRFRFEEDWKSLNQNGVYRSDRGRFRYRLRFGFNYELNDFVIFGGRFRSGDQRNNQSPHVTLGADLKDHSITIDRAFAKIKMSNWSIWIGKNNLPFWKENEMWWDDDVTPEGIALTGSIIGSEKISLKPTFGYFLINSLGGQLTDNSFFTGGQFKLECHFEKSELNIGSGYYYYADVPDKNDLEGLHKIDYKILNTLIEYKINTRIPLAFTIENYVGLEDYSNDQVIASLDLADEKIGYVLSFKAGSLNEIGNVLFSYYYAHIPKYSVVDFLAQDDWVRWGLFNAAGTRSSNFKGHEVRLAYSFGRGFDVVLRTYFVKAIKIENLNQEKLETNNRFRIDFNFKF